MFEQFAHYRNQSHMHVIGASRSGKSRFLEYYMRELTERGDGYCLIDPHGDLAANQMKFNALVKPRRRVIYINLSDPSWTIGLGTFSQTDADKSTLAARGVDALIKGWGAQNTNESPTLEKISRALFHYAATTGQTLPNASLLLWPEHTALREHAISITKNDEIRRVWMELQSANAQRWDSATLSTTNRLARLLATDSIRRTISRKSGNVDLFKAMQQGAIIIVNLKASGHLDREAARVFAALLLNEIFEAAMRRSELKPKTYTLILDEVAQYANPTIAAMLDQSAKAGLHVVLAHQHITQLGENKELLMSILTNCRIKVVFGGLPYEDAVRLAPEMFLPEINEDQIKHITTRIVGRVREETRVSYSKSESRISAESEAFGEADSFGDATGITSGMALTEAGSATELSNTINNTSFMSATSHMRGESRAEGTSYSESIVPFNSIYYEEEEAGREFYNLQEKVSLAAARLKHQEQRECWVKILNEEAQQFVVPFVEPVELKPERIERYRERVSLPEGAMRPEEIDRLAEEERRAFLDSFAPKQSEFSKRRALTKSAGALR